MELVSSHAGTKNSEVMSKSKNMNTAFHVSYIELTLPSSLDICHTLANESSDTDRK